MSEASWSALGRWLADPAPETRIQARLVIIWRDVRLFLGFPSGLIGVVVVVSLVVAALFAPVLTRIDPLAQILVDRLQSPSPAHRFGTDTLGRDVFAEPCLARGRRS